jgi:Bacterial Ig domain/Dockerin type I domain
MSRLLNRIASLANGSRRTKSARRSPRRPRRLVQIEQLEQRRLLAVDSIAQLNDEFEDSASVSEWSRIGEVEGWNADKLDVFDVNNTQAGRMVLSPNTGGWYENYRGPLVFKEVTGDFVFTSEVNITDRDDIGGNDADDVPNDGDFSLGGLMIRTPRAITNPATDWVLGSMQDDGTNDGENYVFLSMGYGNSGEMSFEVKNTRNSNSQLELTPVNSNRVTFQIARIGDAVITMYQLPGQEWIVHRRFSRPDMPATLQVGLVAYTDWEKLSDFDPFFQNSNVLVPGFSPDPTPGEPFNPDIEAGYEYARFDRPQVPASLDGVDLFAAATDAQLIGFLGDNANCESGCGADDLVQVALEAVDTNGTAITSIVEGDSFELRATVDDLRVDGNGVFSAYVDVIFDSNLASVDGPLTFGADYVNAREGNTATDGLIDEAGGVATADALGGEEALLFSVPVSADAAGELIFASDSPELLPAHEFTLYDFDNPVDAALIDFGSLTINVETFAVSDDAISVTEDTTNNTLDVLANDTIAASAEIIAVSNTNAGGTVSIAADGRSLSYSPTNNFFGNETFTYTVRNRPGQTLVGMVTMTVNKQWYNASQPTDVTGDNNTSPLDALQVINVLNRDGSMTLPSVPTGTLADAGYLDTNDDGSVSPVDALLVINELNSAAMARSQANAEGESGSSELVSLATTQSQSVVPAETSTAASLLVHANEAQRSTAPTDFEQDEATFALLGLEEAIAAITEDVLAAWR